MIDEDQDSAFLGFDAARGGKSRLQRLTCFILVAVSFHTIEMSKSSFQRVPCSAYRCGCTGNQHAKAQYSSTIWISISFTFHSPSSPGTNRDPHDHNGNIIYDSGVTLLQTSGAMESLVDRGRCRAIGLSDISLNELLPLCESA